MKGIGEVQHKDVLLNFLQEFAPWLHAVELNGLRSRRENSEVLQFGEALDFPVISGGDQHGCEPNAALNFTQGESFEEFVQEIRHQRHSEIASLPLRLIENAWHALSYAPGEFGRRHWMSRVFIEENGETIALAQFTESSFHRLIDKFRCIVGLVANAILRPALKLPFLGNEEGGL